MKNITFIQIVIKSKTSINFVNLNHHQYFIKSSLCQIKLLLVRIQVHTKITSFIWCKPSLHINLTFSFGVLNMHAYKGMFFNYTELKLMLQIFFFSKELITYRIGWPNKVPSINIKKCYVLYIQTDCCKCQGPKSFVCVSTLGPHIVNLTAHIRSWCSVMERVSQNIQQRDLVM